MSDFLKVQSGQMVSAPVDSLRAVVVSAVAPNVGEVLQATGPNNAAWAPPSGGTDESLFLDLTIMGPAHSSLGGGNWTSGNGFFMTRAATCTGMRFYWPGSSLTLKCSLYGAGASPMASANVAVSAAGIYAATWAPQALVDNQEYWIATYHASNELRVAGSVLYLPQWPFIGGRSLVWSRLGAYASGDAKPVTQNNSDKIPAIPIFTVP